MRYIFAGPKTRGRRNCICCDVKKTSLVKNEDHTHTYTSKSILYLNGHFNLNLYILGIYSVLVRLCLKSIKIYSIDFQYCPVVVISLYKSTKQYSVRIYCIAQYCIIKQNISLGNTIFACILQLCLQYKADHITS